MALNLSIRMTGHTAPRNAVLSSVSLLFPPKRNEFIMIRTEYLRPTAMFLLLFVFTIATLTAQEKHDRQNEQDDEVLRINSALVQTDVMVFDKQGRFAEGLKPEQFQLK